MPAERKYGMDQDYYPWSPINARPVLTWPGNARVALAVIVNLEHWEWEMPAGYPERPRSGLWFGGGRFPDIGGYGNHEYGNRVGVFRVFDVLEKYGIKPIVAMDQAVAQNYPVLIAESKKRGAEFVAHGVSPRRTLHNGMSEAAERAYIRGSIAALEKATGTRPAGWSSPGFHESTRTPNLVAAEGIRYICDFGNDEQPYKMTVKQGELYSLGPNAYLDDEYIHLDGRRTINEVNLLWRDWFDGLYADGAKSGRMMIFNLHPWVIGQPWRIRHLDEVLGHITQHAGVWKATGSEIVDWYKSRAAA
jgi:allantoinase